MTSPPHWKRPKGMVVYRPIHPNYANTNRNGKKNGANGL
jgi:hypothetical protein